MKSFRTTSLPRTTLGDILLAFVGFVGFVGLIGFVGFVGLIGLIGFVGLFEFIGFIGLLGFIELRTEIFDKTRIHLRYLFSLFVDFFKGFF